MTEEEWLRAGQPLEAVHCLADRIKHDPQRLKRFRLIACGCCRAVMDTNWPAACQEVVAVAESYADGSVTGEVLRKAGSTAKRAAQRAADMTRNIQDNRLTTRRRRLTFASGTAGPDGLLPTYLVSGLPFELYTQDELVGSLLPHLLRCIFGNPFRPVVFDPQWRSETAVALATGIYEERAFDRLPILADALEEAGCDNADVLTHCRGSGPHTRGCWVVDGVLGKE